MNSSFIVSLFSVLNVILYYYIIKYVDSVKKYCKLPEQQEQFGEVYYYIAIVFLVLNSIMALMFIFELLGLTMFGLTKLLKK